MFLAALISRYAQTDRALTAMKKDPSLAFLNEVSSVPRGSALPAVSGRGMPGTGTPSSRFQHAGHDRQNAAAPRAAPDSSPA
jgi:hypothetical protein